MNSITMVPGRISVCTLRMHKEEAITSDNLRNVHNRIFSLKCILNLIIKLWKYHSLTEMEF